MTVLSHVLGFPRIGVDRQMKTAVEAYWKGTLDRKGLDATGRCIQEENWKIQQQAGLTFVTVGDFCWYDHVLDSSVMLGVVPERFRSGCQDGKIDLNTMFCMGRGQAPETKEAAACEMTKWFNTNYHYIVPELVQNQKFHLEASKLLDTIDHARSLGHKNIKPVILGPLTYLYMGKVKGGHFDRFQLIEPLTLAYVQLLKLVESKGVEWIQVDEPILGLDLSAEVLALYRPTFDKLKQTKLKILLATYFCGLEDANLDTACQLPIQGLHVDLCASPDQLDRVVQKLPSDRVLSLGLINGRNIWKVDLSKALETLKSTSIKRGVAGGGLWVGSSCSLLHCPVDLDAEHKIDPEIKNWLAFSKQKTHELAWLASGHNHGQHVIETQLTANRASVQSRTTSKRIHNPAVKSRCEKLPENFSKRHNPYPKRAEEQRAVLKLPLFPTTTIGSFPQTAEIRSIRHDLKSGKITEEQYVKKMRGQIDAVVKKQEELDLDVLVHGEPERNDMVEYFGELLDGYTFSQNGWVQSYGSRCVKPPIVFGDVFRPQAMTVQWSVYAQSVTKKPMKGMLTGPVTMLSWSFVRDDQPVRLTSLQLALALRDEIVDLEAGGIRVIQLDEPAFREALPLRRKDWPDYLKWSVHSFRVATCGVKDATQIHTHMCYSEFNDVIDSIAALDADVITIESSRSDMEILQAFENFAYPNEIGPGIYDIHSPRIPSVEEMLKQLETALKFLPPQRLWVNPDCGLKTRAWPETEKSLANMVTAAKSLRQQHPIV